MTGIEDRLVNWGYVQRDHWHRGHCRSIEHRYIPERGLEALEARQTPKPILDYRDAELVEEAWRRMCGEFIETAPQKVLRLTYVWRAPVPFICRRVGIAQDREGIAYLLVLRKAERAIAAALDDVRRNIESTESCAVGIDR